MITKQKQKQKQKQKLKLTYLYLYLLFHSKACLPRFFVLFAINSNIEYNCFIFIDKPCIVNQLIISIILIEPERFVSISRNSRYSVATPTCTYKV
jgi:hypothetical protein